MNQEFMFSVPALEEVSPSVRSIAESIFKNTSLSKRDQSRLKLVFSEVFMNAVKHGSAQFSPVNIHFLLQEDKITIKIEDHGSGKKNLKAEDLKKIVINEEEHNVLTKTSGRGLAQIAKKWTDEFDIKDSELGGICVVFGKNFKAGEEEEVPTIIRNKASSYEIIPTMDMPTAEVGLGEKIFTFSGIIDETTILQKTKEVDEFFKKNEKVGNLIVFDFDQVEFFMSTFIGRLVEWKKEAKEKGGDLKIINIPADLYEILELTGINHLINLTAKK